jgi:hypothetical protein
VPPLTEAQVVEVMERAGVPWEDVFDSIEPSPGDRLDRRCTATL